MGYDDFVYKVCEKDEDVNSQKCFLQEMKRELKDWIISNPYTGIKGNDYDLSTFDCSINAMYRAILACRNQHSSMSKKEEDIQKALKSKCDHKRDGNCNP